MKSWFVGELLRLIRLGSLSSQVFFYIDPEFATDPKMAGVNLLTLSYTFFKVEDDGEEK